MNWARSKPPKLRTSLSSWKGDGDGSIRLGTPTTEQRERSRQLLLDTGAINDGKSRSSSVPIARPTPAARFGYMAPNPASGLGAALTRKIAELFVAMDTNRDKRLTQEESKAFFRRFPKANTDAMFNEVDADGDCVITLDEFINFWAQVKSSGYSEADIDSELNELFKGESWVDYNDSRKVGTPGSEQMDGYSESRCKC